MQAGESGRQIANLSGIEQQRTMFNLGAGDVLLQECALWVIRRFFQTQDRAAGPPPVQCVDERRKKIAQLAPAEAG
ncbi:MAG: hypothetical protein ACRESR_00045, partial [Gammaproteobacteria bacterium]